MLVGSVAVPPSRQVMAQSQFRRNDRSPLEAERRNRECARAKKFQSWMAFLPWQFPLVIRGRIMHTDALSGHWASEKNATARGPYFLAPLRRQCC